MSPQQEGGEEESVHTWGPLCPCHTDAQGGDPQTFPFSSSCSSAEGASSEDLAEAGGVKGLGVLVLSITAARAESLMPLHTSGTVRSGLGVTNHPLVQRTTPGWQSHPTRRLGSMSACTSRRSHTFPRACHEHQLFQQGKLTARLQHGQGFSNFF